MLPTRTGCPETRPYIPEHSSEATLLRFSLSLVRPYTTWLVIVTTAMLLETASTLASPWPLKIVLDSVLGSEPLPAWWARFLDVSPGRLTILNLSAVGMPAIALLQAGSASLAAYYTVSIGQWIAHDLRQSV